MRHPTDRSEAVARLKRTGLTDRVIAQRLHIGLRSVSRIRTEHGIPAAVDPHREAWAARRFAAALRARLVDVADPWWARAACRGWAHRDDDPWFLPDQRGRPHRADQAATELALAICASCTVRSQCLDSALAAEAEQGTRGRHGVFGGTTPAQRHRIATGRTA